MSNPRPGEVYVHGLAQDQARELLAAADRAGVDPQLVRVSDGGFIVPEAVHDQLLSGWAENDAVV